MNHSVSPEPDPRDSFLRDQQDAATEAATREAQQWAIHLSEQYDLHDMRQAEVSRTRALASLLSALAGLAFLLVIAGLGALVVLTVQAFR